MSLNLGGIFGGGNILSTALSVASMAFPQLKLATTLLGMFSSAMQQGVQAGLGQAMQSLGLPKFIADMVGKELQKVLGDAIKGGGEQDAAGTSFVEQFAKSIAQNLASEMEKNSGAAGGGKKGWLRAIAESLGKIATAAAEELEGMSDKITKGDPKQLTEYQAASQEFSLLMNTFTNAIKTIGEGNANATRKG